MRIAMAELNLLSRRRLLSQLGGLGTLGCVPSRRPRDRDSILRALVREVVVGMARDVLVETTALRASVHALAEAPGSECHRSAQAAFEPCALAWKRAQAFRTGPFVESQAFQRATFWPARSTAVQAVLLAAEPIDEQRIEALGVDAKGLFALEVLLFDAAVAEDVARPHGGSAERARRYAAELTDNMLGYAQRMSRLLGDGLAYSRDFALAGQSSVNQLAAQCVDSLEMVRGKFERVKRAPASRDARMAAVEGYFSGTSLAIAGALISGAKQLYLGDSGGGLSDLVTRVSAPIDEHVRAEFAAVEAALLALRAPLELAFDASPGAFEAAHAAVGSLKHVLEVEMAAALAGFA